MLENPEASISRHETIQLQRINPNDLIEEVLHINAERMKEKDLHLEVNLSNDLGEVFLDPARFQQVIRNLVSNAIEACDRQKRIRVETGVFIPSDKAQETGHLERKYVCSAASLESAAGRA